jgi:hypothetical protein
MLLQPVAPLTSTICAALLRKLLLVGLPTPAMRPAPLLALLPGLRGGALLLVLVLLGEPAEGGVWGCVATALWDYH